MEEKKLFSALPKETLKKEAISMILLYTSVFSKLKFTQYEHDVKPITGNCFPLNPELRYVQFRIKNYPGNGDHEDYTEMKK